MLDYGYKKLQAFGSGPYHQWVQNGDGWYFRTADGQLLKGCRAVIDGVEYGFDDAGKMQKGWQKYGEDWYYFRSDGSMVKNDWRQDGDNTSPLRTSASPSAFFQHRQSHIPLRR